MLSLRLYKFESMLNKILIFLSLFFVVSSSLRGEVVSADVDLMFDSLVHAMNNASSDTTKLRLLNKISLEHYSTDSTLKYAALEEELARKLNDEYRLCDAIRFEAWAFYHLGQKEDAMNKLYALLPIAENLQYNDCLIHSYVLLGHCLSYIEDEISADLYYNKSLKLCYEMKEYPQLVNTYTAIAHSYIDVELFDLAEARLDSARKYVELAGKKSVYNIHYYDALLLYTRKGTSQEYQRISDIIKADISELEANEGDLGTILNNIEVLIDLSLLDLKDDNNKESRNRKFEKCNQLFEKYSSYSDRMGYVEPYRYGKYGLYCIRREDFTQAKKYLEMYRDQISEKSEYQYLLCELYGLYRDYYETMGNYKMALAYSDSANLVAKTSDRVKMVARTTNNINHMQSELSMRAQQRLYEAASEKRNMLVVILICAAITLLIVVVVIVISNMRRRKINEKLNRANAELEERHSELEAQHNTLLERNEYIEDQKYALQQKTKQIETYNREILESLEYSSKIQESLMPSQSMLNMLFGDTLVILRPLNIVSGDFYWAQQIGKYKAFAVADCTGHSVPGALMSILGISILNEAVAECDKENVTAGAILDVMRAKLKNALRQTDVENSNHDGLDIALVIIDPQNMTMHYAGAFRPLVVVRNGEVTVYEADRMPIGLYWLELEHFTDHVIELQKGDTLYAYTDGVTDQFGYAPNRSLAKFTAKRLRALLANVYKNPFAAQKILIETVMDEWRTPPSVIDNDLYEQTDDTLIVGIRI